MIVHGHSLKRSCIEKIGLAADRVHVIPHIAIGRPLAHPQVVPEQNGQILFFGRVCEYKGLDYLVRAEPLIRQRVGHGGFVIAGDGPYRDYERLIGDPAKFTIIRRWIDDAERARLFQQASIIVLPYVEATQSGVIPVAYAFGKPVVATDVGALSDVVRNDVTGLLVPPRDEHALAAAIVRLLKDESLRIRLGRAGRQMLDTELSPDVVARQTVDVYEQAIGDVHGARPAVHSAHVPNATTITQEKLAATKT